MNLKTRQFKWCNIILNFGKNMEDFLIELTSKPDFE